MNGEIGVIYQEDKQVGGIYDWKIDITPIPTIRDGWYEFKVSKEVTAQSYWLITVPNGNCFEVKFYKVIQWHLVLMDGGKVEVDLPNRILDHRLYAPLEIRWIGN